MLIFTRRVGEFIRIGDDIRVQVIEVKGRQVRLGIDAPPHISVHREEVYQRIKGQLAKAAADTAPAAAAGNPPETDADKTGQPG